MTSQLPIDVYQRVIARINQGQYGCEAEVLRDAMDALDRLEEEKLLHWNERNALAEQQSENGLAKPLDKQAVISRIRNRLAEEGIIE